VGVAERSFVCRLTAPSLAGPTSSQNCRLVKTSVGTRRPGEPSTLLLLASDAWGNPRRTGGDVLRATAVLADESKCVPSPSDPTPLDGLTKGPMVMLATCCALVRLAVAVAVADLGTGQYAVTWTPPKRGTYTVRRGNGAVRAQSWA
jgi:hypothetical protein